MRVSGDSLMHVHEKVKVFKTSFKIRFVYSCETKTKQNQTSLSSASTPMLRLCPDQVWERGE